jgi:hypothetical protein
MLAGGVIKLMKQATLALRAGALLLLAAVLPAAGPVKHVIVHREAGRFGGWPANHGAWSWGNEILVGFEIGYFQANERGHAIDRSKPAEHVLARSLDGGETWTIERPEGLRPPPGAVVADVLTSGGGRPLRDCPGGIDFTRPGFAFTARMTGIHDGVSRFYYSYDKGKSWDGPFRLPDFGQPGTAARTDYLVNGKNDLFLFLTAAKSNRKEGRVILVRTQDGGKTWKLVSYIGPEPEGDDYAIMPSSVRLSPRRILTTIRHRKFIAAWLSEDNGETWRFLNQPAPQTGGNPPSLVKLQDGRLALTYGYRLPPYGIRARLSADEGRTWSDEIILRQDAARWDLGYTRTVQRPDGKLVTVYYYNDAPEKEHYIAATIWDPGPR